MPYISNKGENFPNWEKDVNSQIQDAQMATKKIV